VKRVFAIFASFAISGFAGCADEGPTGEEVQQQIARGVRGEGQLTPDIDRSNDPYVKPREGAGGPPPGE
jgi:hypothetical protein